MSSPCIQENEVNDCQSLVMTNLNQEAPQGWVPLDGGGYDTIPPEARFYECNQYWTELGNNSLYEQHATASTNTAITQAINRSRENPNTPPRMRCIPNQRQTGCKSPNFYLEEIYGEADEEDKDVDTRMLLDKFFLPLNTQFLDPNLCRRTVSIYDREELDENALVGQEEDTVMDEIGLLTVLQDVVAQPAPETQEELNQRNNIIRAINKGIQDDKDRADEERDKIVNNVKSTDEQKRVAQELAKEAEDVAQISQQLFEQAEIPSTDKEEIAEEVLVETEVLKVLQTVASQPTPETTEEQDHRTNVMQALNNIAQTEAEKVNEALKLIPTDSPDLQDAQELAAYSTEAALRSQQLLDQAQDPHNENNEDSAQNNGEGPDGSDDSDPCRPAANGGAVVDCGVNAVCLPNDPNVGVYSCVCGPGFTGGPTPPDANQISNCDPIICGLGEHVVNHECTPCAAGSTRNAGDRAPDGDTSCTVVPGQPPPLPGNENPESGDENPESDAAGGTCSNLTQYSQKVVDDWNYARAPEKWIETTCEEVHHEAGGRCSFKCVSGDDRHIDVSCGVPLGGVVGGLDCILPEGSGDTDRCIYHTSVTDETLSCGLTEDWIEDDFTTTLIIGGLASVLAVGAFLVPL